MPHSPWPEKANGPSGEVPTKFRLPGVTSDDVTLEGRSMKMAKRACMLEFKELAVKRGKDGPALAAVAKELGRVEQALRNRVKAAAAGKLGGADGKVVTPQERELSRLRAETSGSSGSWKSQESSGGLREGCAMKYAWIDAPRQEFALADLCATLEVSPSDQQAGKRGGTPDRQRLTDSRGRADPRPPCRTQGHLR